MRLLQQIGRDQSKWRLFKYSPTDGALQSLPSVDSKGGGGQATTKLSAFWWRRTVTSIPNLLCKVLLPDGYPKTVHPHYMPFTSWNFLHMMASSAVGVLSTQSLLFGLGLASGGHGMALSATLNWILKDGLGQLGGVAVVAYLGGRFDMQAKRYRFLGAVLLKISCLIELMVPLLPGYFVLTAAMANVLKNVSWMATSATRAQIHRHLAKQDNLGDLTGRTASQNTLASLLGTGVGVSLSATFLNAPGLTSTETVYRCLLLFAPLAVASLWTSYKSCQYATSPRLTPRRMAMLWRPMLEELLLVTTASPTNPVTIRNDVLSQLPRYILDPCTLAVREPFIWDRPVYGGKRDTVELLIEPPIVAERDGAAFAPDRCFWLRVGPDNKLRIWFVTTATDPTILKGMLTAQILIHCASRGRAISPETAEKLATAIEEPLKSALIRRGWDTHEINLGTRRPITIIDSKTM